MTEATRSRKATIAAVPARKAVRRPVAGGTDKEGGPLAASGAYAIEFPSWWHHEESPEYSNAYGAVRKAIQSGSFFTQPVDVPSVEPLALHLFAHLLWKAPPVERMESERAGMQAAFLKRLAQRLKIDYVRMFDIVGVPKATAEKKAAANEAIVGAPGQAALGMVRLLAMADEMLLHSTAPEAEKFDTVAWLGRWIEIPQPALGGRKPADMLDTPTGLETVAKLMGALESGAYL